MRKANLKPGETQTVSFPIDVEALKFWNQRMQYDAEPGKFNVFIGVDSARVKQGEFELLVIDIMPDSVTLHQACEIVPSGKLTLGLPDFFYCIIALPRVTLSVTTQLPG